MHGHMNVKFENDNLNVIVSCKNWYQGFGLLGSEAV